MNADEKRKVFEELLEEYQDVISSEFSYEDGEREAERKTWLNKYDGIKEPLIKDEKVRKVVRAWADANNIDPKHYYHNMVKFDSSEHRLTWIRTSIEFDSIRGLENLDDEKYYTIAELCGEEEE